MEVNISDLIWDQFIYPRGGKSEKTINAYVEALAIGAQFPPIKIQRVFNYTDADGNETIEAIIILDGIHRWSTFKEKGIKEIAAVEWKDEPLDYEKNKVALLLESAQCNTSHGDRLSSNDKKRIARDIASTDPACPPSLSPRRYSQTGQGFRSGEAGGNVNVLKIRLQKNLVSVNRPSTHGSLISVPGKKQTETALSSSSAALDGPRKKLQK